MVRLPPQTVCQNTNKQAYHRKSPARSHRESAERREKEKTAESIILSYMDLLVRKPVTITWNCGCRLKNCKSVLYA